MATLGDIMDRHANKIGKRFSSGLTELEARAIAANALASGLLRIIKPRIGRPPKAKPTVPQIN